MTRSTAVAAPCCHRRLIMIFIAVVLQSTLDLVTGFSIQTISPPLPGTGIRRHQQQQHVAVSRRLCLWAKARRSRSVVEDLDGPTPDLESDEPDLIDPADIPELEEMQRVSELPTPIPHQTWRKGDMAGCDAPIAAEWRHEAEEIITKAVELVGGSVLDVTWFLTAVLVTIDEETLPSLVDTMAKSDGPVIDIVDPASPIYKDPTDPNPEEIWDDEDDILYQRETEEEAAAAQQRRKSSYASKDKDDPPDEPHIQDQIYDPDDDVPLYMNEETRTDVAVKVLEDEQQRYDESEKPIDLEAIRVNTAAISVIANAILDALQDREDELKILSRHELVLTSPGAPDVIETQRQFDAYRGSPVIVETQDPFDSNRTLKGKLVDRNSMDLFINQKGRLVTIPHNFIKCVRLPSNIARMEEDADMEATA